MKHKNELNIVFIFQADGEGEQQIWTGPSPTPSWWWYPTEYVAVDAQAGIMNELAEEAEQDKGGKIKYTMQWNNCWYLKYMKISYNSSFLVGYNHVYQETNLG